MRRPERCGSRDPAVRQRRAEVHPAHTGPLRRRLAQRARSGSRIQHGTGQHPRAKPLLRITDGFALGMRIRVPVLDDPARPFADKPAVQHQHGPVGLIAPRLRPPTHLHRRPVPARVGPRWLSLRSGRSANPRPGGRCSPHQGGAAVDRQRRERHVTDLRMIGFGTKRRHSRTAHRREGPIPQSIPRRHIDCPDPPRHVKSLLVSTRDSVMSRGSRCAVDRSSQVHAIQLRAQESGLS